MRSPATRRGLPCPWFKLVSSTGGAAGLFDLSPGTTCPSCASCSSDHPASRSVGDLPLLRPTRPGDSRPRLSAATSGAFIPYQPSGGYFHPKNVLLLVESCDGPALVVATGGSLSPGGLVGRTSGDQFRSSPRAVAPRVQEELKSASSIICGASPAED